MEYVSRETMGLKEKLGILSDAAKYDAACTSSGVMRRGNGREMGNAEAAGICHSFSADGRCISLLKILMTNECIYDCRYCINRCSNDVPRAVFTPEEICKLTIDFYRRNYIEGLFLSSGIIGSPNQTMELLYRTLFLLRHHYGFQGYIHVKAIPGADAGLIQKTGLLADRMSVNLELPTAEGLRMLAPNKHRNNILLPMRQIQNGITANKNELALYRHAPRFVPAGQSTQVIVGATGESDYQILSVAESLYQKFALKRVFYSAFVHVNEDSMLPALPGGPPLLREHRLYQADWLLRFYGFKAEELLNETKPNFNILLDPKCDWALSHLEQFPVEIQSADYEMLLRVPGIGVKSALRIVKARKSAYLGFEDLKKMGVVLKRALYFVTCRGKQLYPVRLEEDFITRNLLYENERLPFEKDQVTYRQLSLFDDLHYGKMPESGGRAMEENILICEDCMEGIFTAVYIAYEKRYLPEHTKIQTSEGENMSLFAVYETVKTDRMKSEKVIRTLRKRFGEEAFLFFCYVLSSADERKATALYRTIAKGLRLSVPASVLERGAEEEVGIVHKLKENVWREMHHLYGFLRFKELEKGVLFAEIRPKNNILEFLAAHFADRFPMEHFLIYDAGRRWLAVHEAGKEWYLADGDYLLKEELTESREEGEIQELFRHFCHNITIKERHNTKLQRNLLPLRFRPYMTEFQKSGSKGRLSV